MTSARQGEKGEALAPDIEVERRGLCEGIGDSRVSKGRDWEMVARGFAQVYPNSRVLGGHVQR